MHSHFVLLALFAFFVSLIFSLLAKDDPNKGRIDTNRAHAHFLQLAAPADRRDAQTSGATAIF